MATTDTRLRALGERAVSRRTLARGAAWTAPLVAAGVAAPAFAASGTGALKAQLVTATWKPGAAQGSRPNVWAVLVRFDNTGSQQATVTGMKVYTTYHAANGTPDRLVYSEPGWWNQIPGSYSAYTVNTGWVPDNWNTTPPRDASGKSLIPTYYNDYGTQDGKIPCVSQDAYPADAGYPESCRRLKDDHTFLTFSYIYAGVEKSATAPMNDLVGCQVARNCTT